MKRGFSFLILVLCIYKFSHFLNRTKSTRMSKHIRLQEPVLPTLFTIFQSLTPSVLLCVQMKKTPPNRQYLVLRGCLKTLIKLRVKWSKKPNQVVVLTCLFSRETIPFPSLSLANCSHKTITPQRRGLKKCRICPSFKHFHPTHFFVHRVDGQILRTLRRFSSPLSYVLMYTIVPSSGCHALGLFLRTLYSSFPMWIPYIQSPYL